MPIRLSDFNRKWIVSILKPQPKTPVCRFSYFCGYNAGMKIPPFATAQILSLEDPPEYVIHGIAQRPIARSRHAPSATDRLIRACHDGELELVVELFPLSENSASPSTFGITPLSAACSSGHARIVRWLLEHGASPEAASFTGTPLHCALYSSRDATECMIAIKDALGERFAPDLILDVFTHDFLSISHAENLKLALSWIPIDSTLANSLLFKRAHRSCATSIDALTCFGAEINHEDPETGLTPLIQAITVRNPRSRDKLQAIEILLRRGASPHHKTQMGLAPLTAAAVVGSLEACKALLDMGANPLDALTPECFPQAALGQLPSFAADAGRHIELAHYLRAVEASWTEARELSALTQGSVQTPMGQTPAKNWSL